MEFELQSSRPIWQQLAEQLSRRIVTGVYAPGPTSVFWPGEFRGLV